MCKTSTNDSGNARKCDENATVSFKANEKQLLKKYNKIWEKVEKLMRMDFETKPVYGDDEIYILEKAINMEAKNIANTYKLAERIDHLPKTECFITLKDHKENFYNKPTCCLNNPTKNELGKISKQMVERINQRLLK